MEKKWVDTQKQFQMVKNLEKLRMGKTNPSTAKNVFSFAKVGMDQQQAMIN